MQNRQNNFNYNQYYTPSMNNQYLYNKNKENILNQPNNNTRAFSPNPNKAENKQINTRNYTYLNKQEIPLKNSNKQNIPNQRSPFSSLNNRIRIISNFDFNSIKSIYFT